MRRSEFLPTKFDRFVGDFNGLPSQPALLSCSAPQCPSEKSDCHGSDSASENPVLVPVLTNIPEPSNRYVISGAITVSGVLILLAYLVIDWSKQTYDEQQEDCSNDEQRSAR
jgi:hypothetical protein